MGRYCLFAFYNGRENKEENPLLTRGSVIPANVKIGKNVAIVGKTTAEDYPEGILASGESIIR